MCSVHLCIPSKRPPEQALLCLQKWAAMGYGVALYCDTVEDLWAKEPKWPNKPQLSPFNGIWGEYPGYAVASNRLVKMVLDNDRSCDWCVLGGDDLFPDEKHAAEDIAQQCSEHFCGTFGVCQPTGDVEFGDAQGPYCRRVAGSAWVGREWCLRANKGAGPLYPDFDHMFGDECLMETAKKLSVFWQRPDLLHYHAHWARKRGMAEDMPAFLAKWNTPEHWQKSKALFERLKSEDFAPCMPL